MLGGNIWNKIIIGVNMLRNLFIIIRSALRRAWLRSPERTEALLGARREYKGDNVRQKWEYQCNKCRKWFIQKEVSVDHIIPCGTFLKHEDWSTFGPALFCDSSGLQVLCKTCHNAKTKEERKNAKKT